MYTLIKSISSKDVFLNQLPILNIVDIYFRIIL